jgi:hypothetical protein
MYVVIQLYASRDSIVRVLLGISMNIRDKHPEEIEARNNASDIHLTFTRLSFVPPAETMRSPSGLNATQKTP